MHFTAFEPQCQREYCVFYYLYITSGGIFGYYALYPNTIPQYMGGLTKESPTNSPLFCPIIGN